MSTKTVTSRKNISNRQKQFVYAYFANKGNGKQAAIEAGYSKKTAEQQASRMLRSVKVQKILADLNAKVEEKAIITREQVIQEYAKIALFDLRTMYDENNALKPVADLSAEAGAAIAGIEVDQIFDFVGGVKAHVGNTTKVKLASKIAALDSIRDTMGWRASTKTDITVTKVGMDLADETYE